MAPTRKAKKGLLGSASTSDNAAASSSGKKAQVRKADWKEGFKKKTAGVSDMTLLSTISNETINDNLRKRYENAEIYTYIGHVLISVNPFRMLPIYNNATLHSYRGKNRLEMPPHVYAVSESAYYNMTSYNQNQCVIISGESGAGKTEAAKRFIEYTVEVSKQNAAGSSKASRINEMVLATQPLLESFGCAKTLRNNNSSRHGKYLEIEFDAAGVPIGGIITNYLLEKSRVVGQIDDERNFHIFYQLTKAATPAQREAYGLQGPEAYAYTSRSRCFDVPGIDDVQDFRGTLEAMNTVGLTAAEQDEIFRALATVLWLGNVSFVEDQEGNAAIKDQSVPDFVAYLLQVDPAAVSKALTSRVIEAQRAGRRGSVYDVPLNPAQASAVRDALAKSIYERLFEWLVTRVNQSMKSPPGATQRIIGVLDIYGFEIFKDNSYEQLCINYVNERLQQIFIELTLKREQEEYDREQIKWTPISYFNNKIVCDLIDGKRPPGVFAALNDACATAHADPTAADSSFVQRMGMLSAHKHFEGRGDKFLIKHYAGDVTYNIAGMTDKNKDVLSKDLLDLVNSSGNPFFHTLFPDHIDPNSKKRPPTASDKITSSANALVEKLMRSEPSYIRTIKPNENKSPSEFNTANILHQIKYLGLQENIRVRRAGFAYRNTFEKMVERFYLLSPATSYAGDYIWNGDSRSGCERILKDTGIAREEWQMGTTKAFIKNPETLFFLEHMRDRYWHNMAARIQRAFRNYMRYKHECANRIQRFWKNKKEGLAYVQLRDYGHTVLASRKERRRFSLISMRQFRGDYLDVNGRSAQGTMLRQACGLGNETVAFSTTIHLLVSKLGRSSKPSPRYFVLTDKAAYICITQLVQGRATTSVERKIPLVTISAVASSTLRDDWVALRLQSSVEGDLLFSCLLKTELIVHLLQRTNGNISVTVAPSIEYSKKKDKKAIIQFKKDETIRRDDVYKSSIVSVSTGEPAASVSRPPAQRKPGVARPITSGKLLRAGGPDKPRPKQAPKPQVRELPGATKPLPPPALAGIMSGAIPLAPPAPVAASRTPVAPTPPADPMLKTAPASNPLRAAAPAIKPVTPKAPAAPMASLNGALPKPPPPPPAARAPPPPPAPPAKPMLKALYDFATTETGELNLTKNEQYELVQKDDNGWWLVKKNGAEGWAPSNYLAEVKKPTPAPKPAARPNGTTTPKPAVGAKPGTATPPVKANGAGPGQLDLAAALAKRQAQMNGN
ncbi:uncharacterized protein L969DRAFT_624263 [Mixia osmundae IAM 14324]|uniref:Myosin-1 n=1 Tax=Mixia osmundae (strain CBS 9802 / IAM 14324 / JCM 22182 / KY 12970) TaxID=764103 RepID=G7E1A7_MIXOS|nr:uncharacterized protein L969DRAFT_624263 [Mixia osmundae IAM 14324]KEI38745.1 hypothetical protein L969DRAFT_624263 [Mixia osmundae IAM 14324]GAA96617.1 hypothetical protein E5Q_03287 [Mixia osmundae IAM 14324]